MSKLELIIDKLLRDEKIEFFSTVAAYRREIHDNLDAARYLLSIMRDDPALSGRAGRMLSLFFEAGLKSLVNEFDDNNTEWRTWLLIIASSIVINIQNEGREISDQDIYMKILPLLSDTSVIDNPQSEESPVEFEYEETRVCDEAYILLRFMQNPDHDDEELFYDLSIEERDFEIRSYKNVVNNRFGDAGVV